MNHNAGATMVTQLQILEWFHTSSRNYTTSHSPDTRQVLNTSLVSFSPMVKIPQNWLPESRYPSRFSHKSGSANQTGYRVLVLVVSLLLLLQGKPVEILPFLYLGSAYHASRGDYLSDLHINALLNVSRRDLRPAWGHYHYKWIPVEDSHMADISSHFQEAIHFIGESHLNSDCDRLRINVLYRWVFSNLVFV